MPKGLGGLGGFGKKFSDMQRRMTEMQESPNSIRGVNYPLPSPDRIYGIRRRNDAEKRDRSNGEKGRKKEQKKPEEGRRVDTRV